MFFLFRKDKEHERHLFIGICGDSEILDFCSKCKIIKNHCLPRVFQKYYVYLMVATPLIQ